LISPERPVADEFPAFSAVVAGTDGRIWVREYQRPAAATARTMVAFDTEGRAVCRMTVPGFEVLEIGPNYLLAKTEDSLGVERVRLFTLHAPASR
jgi:hypothetical protein